MVSGPFEVANESGLDRPRATGVARLLRSIAPDILEQADRWPLWLPACLAGGIAAYFSLPVEPADAVFALALLAAVGLGIGAGRGWAVPASLFLVAFLLGFTLAKARTEAVRAPVLGATSGLVTIVGAIEATRPAARSMVRLRIAVEGIEGVRAEAWPAVVEVTARRPAGRLRLGDRVSLGARLAPPGRPVEPGGYDPALRLWFEGVGATGFSMEAPSVLPDRGAVGGSIKGAIESVRATIGNRIGAALPPLEASIATALVTGERGNIPTSVNDDLRASGLYHILSISGLHLTLVAGAVFWGLRAGLALSPYLALNYPIKKWAAAGSLLAALGYLAISGAEVATQRAVLMLAIMCLAVMLDRPALSMRNVAIAGLAILLWTPEALVSASFQMSFLAVLGLIAFVEIYAGWRSRRPPESARSVSTGARLGRFVLVTLAVTAATTLIASLFTSLPAAYHFNRIAYYAVLANVLAMPLVSFIIMPAGLIATALMPLGLEAAPLHLMALGIDGTLEIARWVASLPGSTEVVRSMPTLAALSMSAGAIWFCLWRGRLRAWAAIPVLLGLLLAPWGSRPDILIENAARNVAVRTAEGLAVARPRRARYAIERWLLDDGDDAALAAAAKRSGWTCEEDVCRAEVKGRRVVYVSEPAAAALPCADADILIADFPLRGRCRAAPTRIDRFDVWRNGAYAISISEGGDVVTTTVAQVRGLRPWTSRPVARRTILEADRTETPPAVQE